VRKTLINRPVPAYSPKPDGISNIPSASLCFNLPKKRGGLCATGVPPIVPRRCITVYTSHGTRTVYNGGIYTPGEAGWWVYTYYTPREAGWWHIPYYTPREAGWWSIPCYMHQGGRVVRYTLLYTQGGRVVRYTWCIYTLPYPGGVHPWCIYPTIPSRVHRCA